VNLSELCPDGRELYAEYRKWEEQWERGKLPQLKRLVTVALQEFQDHRMTCELCEEE
jgi:hypothetical protein